MQTITPSHVRCKANITVDNLANVDAPSDNVQIKTNWIDLRCNQLKDNLQDLEE